jgi:hypothetical protein
VPLAQEVAGCRSIGRGDMSHARPMGLAAAALLLALALLPGSALEAQSRGSLQVAARVIPVQVHAEALAQVIPILSDRVSVDGWAGTRRTALATVRLEARPAQASTAATEPRLVTVNFLRN